MSYLRIRNAQAEPFEVELKQERFSIGRAPTNDLHFQNPWLSRVHALIVLRDGKHVVIDQRSRNGTYLNGQFVREQQALHHGDRIAIGDIQIRYLTSRAEVEVSVDGGTLAKGTVMLSSEDLSFDTYREPTAATAVESSSAMPSLLPALNAAASALIAHLPLEKLIERVLDLVLDAVPAERAVLMLQHEDEGEELKLESARGYREAEVVQISRTIIDTVLRDRQAVLTIDAQSDDRFERAQSIMLQGIRSIMCVPLWNNRDVIGLIYLDHRFSGQVFGENDLRLVGLIANMAAVKIENAQLLAAQLEQERLKQQLVVGAQIQRKLLPDGDPDIRGYDICGINRSCYEIGGDYYDFIPKDDGKLGVVIADISGKGIGAALLMAVLQASLRALLRTATSPAELVAELNQVLIDNSPYNKFATVFYAELDPERHTVCFVNGGHNPGLLRRRDGVEELGSTGPIVGMIEQANFTGRAIELAPGDTLLLYTDGITELTNDSDEELGAERLEALVASDQSVSSSGLIEAVQGAMHDFSPSDQLEDDSTLVVIRRLPDGTPDA